MQKFQYASANTVSLRNYGEFVESNNIFAHSFRYPYLTIIYDIF